jgi:ketosteroid isomerase-like protein
VASANLELLHSIHAAWERGDYSSADWAHPEIEYVHADGPAPGSWVGVAGMAEAWREWLSVWEEYHSEVDKFRALDGEHVLVFFRLGARGKASGLELGQMRTKGASLWQIVEGKVTRLVIYWDREHALTDVGLSSETDSSRA